MSLLENDMCSGMDKVSIGTTETVTSTGTSVDDSKKTTSPSSSKKPSAPLYVPPRARSKSPDEECIKSSTKSTTEGEDDDWDSLYDDSGNCIKPELVSDFKSSIGLKSTKQVIVQEAKCDIDTSTTTVDTLNHSHVVELYDFDPELKESDIFIRISSLVGRSRDSFDIVWVDETHALLVFTSETAARNVLELVIPDLKMRPLSEASSQSRSKAARTVDRLLPPKKRPQTSNVAAVRLIQGHLGVRSKATREQQKAEAKILKDARAQRRQDKEVAEAVWEGNV